MTGKGLEVNKGLGIINGLLWWIIRGLGLGINNGLLYGIINGSGLTGETTDPSPTLICNVGLGFIKGLGLIGEFTVESNNLKSIPSGVESVLGNESKLSKNGVRMTGVRSKVELLEAKDIGLSITGEPSEEIVELLETKDTGVSVIGEVAAHRSLPFGCGAASQEREKNDNEYRVVLM